MHEESSTDHLRAELAQVSVQLDTYAFRQDNQRISAFLRSPEGKQLSRQARQHLELRISANVANATKADPEVERLFLREHEIEMVLWKREDADFYAIEGSIEELPDA